MQTVIVSASSAYGIKSLLQWTKELFALAACRPAQRHCTLHTQLGNCIFIFAKEIIKKTSSAHVYILFQRRKDYEKARTCTPRTHTHFVAFVSMEMCCCLWAKVGWVNTWKWFSYSLLLFHILNRIFAHTLCPYIILSTIVNSIFHFRRMHSKAREMIFIYLCANLFHIVNWN